MDSIPVDFQEWVKVDFRVLFLTKNLYHHFFHHLKSADYYTFQKENIKQKLCFFKKHQRFGFEIHLITT